MKAIVHHAYGSPDVLRLEEIDTPVPKDDEVLVRVHATSVNIAEWYAMTGLLIARPGQGWRKPKNIRLGADFAGVVEEVGANVRRFHPGDEVVGGRGGAFAEYVCVREEGAIVKKPANVTFEEAAAAPTAGITALQGLRDYGQIRPGQQVLINGSSGGVGTFAIQIAKALGADVTAVCSSRNLDMARSLGADRVIDYTREDFTRSERRYNLLLDIAGGRSWFECRRVLAQDATFVIVGGPKTNRVIGPLSHVLRIKLASLRASQKVVFFIAKFNQPDFEVLGELLGSGQVKPFIERTYPMSEMAEAMRYMGTGHVRGKLVVQVQKG